MGTLRASVPFLFGRTGYLTPPPNCSRSVDRHPGTSGIFVDTSFIGFAGIQEDKYATEGAAECLHYAFPTLQAPEVIADIRMENKASIRVAERIGMTDPNGAVRQNRLWKNYAAPALSHPAITSVL